MTVTGRLIARSSFVSSRGRWTCFFCSGGGATFAALRDEYISTADRLRDASTGPGPEDGSRRRSWWSKWPGGGRPQPGLRRWPGIVAGERGLHAAARPTGATTPAAARPADKALAGRQPRQLARCLVMAWAGRTRNAQSVLTSGELDDEVTQARHVDVEGWSSAPAARTRRGGASRVPGPGCSLQSRSTSRRPCSRASAMSSRGLGLTR